MMPAVSGGKAACTALACGLMVAATVAVFAGSRLGAGSPRRERPRVAARARQAGVDSLGRFCWRSWS
jgi:hypothetical protein